ncbi:MAG: 4-hydroxythreonine-4-phosphate dehydrogenase PdxA [Deltaproteobacteria bacterium]|nr:4-hydroxythreonine-4-phosphate dehydrogenase PdxA [Deltaproteobacteria bacterium]
MTVLDANSPRRPTIGVTPGDAAGVGPEVIGAALGGLPDDVDARLYASESVIALVRRACVAAGSAPRFTTRILAARGDAAVAGVSSDASRLEAYDALDAVAHDATAGAIDAILTGPVPKAVFAHLTPSPPGQTEFLAERMGAGRFAMLLAGSRLKVVPVTTHVPLRDVAATLSTRRIVDATLAAALELRTVYDIAAPRIAVCGLNPHAGEGGRIGDEEATIIAPAIATLRGHGVDVVGPVAADTAFRDGYQGAFDLVIAMYHDQALGPLKTVHFADAVNFTCGLPVPRLSPDHGTAYAIAGKGVADAASTTLALRLACAAARAASARRAALASMLALALLVGCGRTKQEPTVEAPTPAVAEAPAPPIGTAAPAPAEAPAAAPNVAPGAAPAEVAAVEGAQAGAVVAGLWPLSHCELPGADLPLLTVGPAAVAVHGEPLIRLRCRVAAEDCADPAHPPTAARLYLGLDDRAEAGPDVVIVPALLPWARAHDGREVGVLPDRRLSLRSLHEIVQTLRAAGAKPVLLGTSAAGTVVRHFPDDDAPDALQPADAAVRDLPADTHALVLEVDQDGYALTALRGEGGLMRRPSRALRGLRDRISSWLAARPELGEITIDIGDGVGVQGLYDAAAAVRDACLRDATGGCARGREHGHAAPWLLRGAAEWTDGAADPQREGAPRPAPTPPDTRAALRPINGTRLPSRPVGAQPRPGELGAQRPDIGGAGLDERARLLGGATR